jgi:putative sterol carrier protein
MAKLTEVLFRTLAERGYEPSLGGVSGTVRFDLHDGKRTEYWRLAIDKGNVTVTQSKDDADCVMTCDIALFEDIVAGKTNAMAALLRGAIAVEGEPLLLVLVQRLFPARSSAPPERRQAGYARRAS